jgi:hypothetical protein
MRRRIIQLTNDTNVVIGLTARTLAQLRDAPSSSIWAVCTAVEAHLVEAVLLWRKEDPALNRALPAIDALPGTGGLLGHQLTPSDVVDLAQVWRPSRTCLVS